MQKRIEFKTLMRVGNCLAGCAPALSRELFVSITSSVEALERCVGFKEAFVLKVMTSKVKHSSTMQSVLIRYDGLKIRTQYTAVKSSVIVPPLLGGDVRTLNFSTAK